MSSGWIDASVERAPRPASAVMLDMGTGQPAIPKTGVAPSMIFKQLLPYTIGTLFVATDDDDITWGADGASGDSVITFADGTTQTIIAGSLNLANANPYYIYCTLGDTSLNNTQTFGDAIGGENVLIAFAIKGANSDSKALIVAGTKGPKLFIDTLSSITGNFGLINAGEIRIGSGTLGGDPKFTGWRLWVDTNVGRMAGYALDVLQWYSDTDGKLYAGAGAVTIDADGITINGQYIQFEFEGSPVGYIDVAAAALQIIGSTKLYLYTSSTGGGISMKAGGLPTAPTTNDLRLEAVDAIYIEPGGLLFVKPLDIMTLETQSGYGISISAGGAPTAPTVDDLYLEAADDVNILATGGVAIGSGGNTPAPGVDNIIISAAGDAKIFVGANAADRTYIEHMEVSWNDITASRVIDTEYQNTSGEPMVVCITVTLNNGDSTSFQIGATSGALTQVGQCLFTDAAESVRLMQTLVVPVNYYYKAVGGGTPVLVDWHEYGLGW